MQIPHKHIMEAFLLKLLKWECSSLALPNIQKRDNWFIQRLHTTDSLKSEPTSDVADRYILRSNILSKFVDLQ